MTLLPGSSMEITAYPLWAYPLRGTAVVNPTLAAPGFGPTGMHPQAFGPSWAGALRLRFWPQVAGWCRRQLCLVAPQPRQLITLSSRMPLYLKRIAIYAFLLGCAINAAQRLTTVSIAIATTWLAPRTDPLVRDRHAYLRVCREPDRRSPQHSGRP